MYLPQLWHYTTTDILLLLVVPDRLRLQKNRDYDYLAYFDPLITNGLHSLKVIFIIVVDYLCVIDYSQVFDYTWLAEKLMRLLPFWVEIYFRLDSYDFFCNNVNQQLQMGQILGQNDPSNWLL